MLGIIDMWTDPKAAWKGVLVTHTLKYNRPFANLKCRYSHHIGFVAQDDICFPDLTVRENILHTSRIRLFGKLKYEEISLHVDKIIAYLGLSHVEDHRVGSIEQRGISGGERKRVCIAREIAAMPMAVILDEPTSGLDAANALTVMTMLKNLSTLGVTVICSIHQPRADIFQLLDNVLILASGEIVYLDAASKMKEYFTSIGVFFSAEKNPADIVMDTITHESVGLSVLWRERRGILGNVLEGNQQSQVQTQQVANDSQPTLKFQVAAWPHQVLQYILCGFRQQKGQPFGIGLEMFTAAACGTLIGLSMYENKGHLFQGIFQQPYAPLSSAVDYSSVPIAGLLSALAISKSSFQTFLLFMSFYALT
ncbi:P-loop containing nucleoside triphosphate hydrolase protein [Penicillium taxi]|uniref:P-loop containing nucleoside triphosphate hydrolase protein n=1 Tax=Penicillium taxi TaxID=168475 RepID=UPI002544FDD6|nr:P-loop containing nucleoside triphosphate hydrolase protein [Penicillium taxi]KAJ5907788.1 P-loop containing nucleoside triphosphate hydrolase protein [Penicillium taxi]